MDFVDDKWLTGTLRSQSSCSLNKTRCCCSAGFEKRGSARSSLLNAGSAGTRQTWAFPGAPVLPAHSAAPGKKCGKKQAWDQMNAPRATGWAPSCSPSFANAVLPTTFSIAFWTACITYCSFSLAVCSFLPPAFMCPLCFSMDCTSCVSFLLFSPNPFPVTCHHAKLAPSALPDISLVKPCSSLYHELLPFFCFMTQWLEIRENKLNASLVCHLAFISPFIHRRSVRSVT